MSALDSLETMLKAFPPPSPPKAKKPGVDEEEPDPSAPPSNDGSDGGGDGLDDGSTPPGQGDDDSDGIPNADDPDDDGDGVPDEQDGDTPDDGSVPPGDDAAAQAGAPGAQGGGGDQTALAEQLVQAERDFYAAVGFHGQNHHNTQRAMDTFHRIVRKFVRAVTGGQVSDDMAPGQEAGAQGQPGASGKPPPGVPGKGAAPAGPGDADGDGVPDEQDADADGDGYDDDAFDGAGDDNAPPGAGDDDAAPPADDEDPQAAKLKKQFGKSRRLMEHGYRVFARKHGVEAFVGLRKAFPANDNSWYYPELDALTKGTYDFRDRDVERVSKVPEQFLFPYLVAFVEAAYQECCYDETAKDDPAKAASKIMLKLVTLLPNSANLKSAAEKYKVTEAGIAKILKDKGIITPVATEAARYAATPRDADSLAAMGVTGFGKSDWWGERADLAHAQVPLRLVPPPAGAQLVDDRAASLRVQPIRPNYGGRDTLAKATISSSCIIHASADHSKTGMLAHSFAKCSCPR